MRAMYGGGVEGEAGQSVNFYNDNDPRICAWLRELVQGGLIPDGIVACRSITDIQPEELDGYTQCHFFCGIAGWPLALKLAGWPEHEPVWTGSCPCQPYSRVGRGIGDADPRNLWPVFRKLIEARKPARVFGEQVDGEAGRDWLAHVLLDLESADYQTAAAPLCSAGFSNHVRPRLFWAAAHAPSQRIQGLEQAGNPGRARPWGARSTEDLQLVCESPFSPGPGWPKPLLRAGDDGVCSRVVGCLGAGNAIDPQIASEFVKAFMDCLKELK